MRRRPRPASLGARPDPHALDLGHAGIELAHAGGADDRARGVLDDEQDTRHSVVLALPVGDVVVEPVAVEPLADVREVGGQLAVHRRAVPGLRAGG